MKRIPLARPDITPDDIREVVKVLRSPYICQGPQQEAFQKAFAGYIGTRYAEAVNSGTSALHLVMRSFGIGEGDEVITSPYSFIASSNCILFTGARPVFVDIDPGTLNMDPAQIEKKITRRTKAILAVHVFGMPADMFQINKIARKHNLVVIEDACEAIGAEIRGKKAGSFSDAAVFAFYPNKQITTGEGGMIVTDRKAVADMCRSLKNQGRDPSRKQSGFLRLGHGYRISDINCALGLSQLSRIEKILERREKVARMYHQNLSQIEGISPLPEQAGYRRSWFVYMVRLAADFDAQKKKKIIQGLARKGISCGEYFDPIHLEPFYKKMFGYRPGDYPLTENMSERIFALPFYPRMTRSEIAFVCRELKRQLERTTVR